ncbi:hypothetical protein BDV23DRAFT_161038 [Aspergillus alliaceus]|uniref:Uncharacterized protein n=1 Tax=Petromyces alliaceus TaxID=209559 RepID=A0A5N7C093_PETAA|nr:hypothetical protein BDV23DRAFT_161038 [Aspergillus alliaceus]
MMGIKVQTNDRADSLNVGVIYKLQSNVLFVIFSRLGTEGFSSPKYQRTPRRTCLSLTGE